MPTRKVYGPLFFREDTLMGTSYLEVLPKLHEDGPENFIWQQDWAPPHFRRDVRRWLNDVLPHRWIGRGDRGDLILCSWPAWFSDLTLCDYFL